MAELLDFTPYGCAVGLVGHISRDANSRLKEEFGGSTVMVRGAKKVGLHLMFGVIALFADQLLKLIS